MKRHPIVVASLLAAAAALLVVLLAVEAVQFYGYVLFIGAPFVLGYVATAYTPPAARAGCFIATTCAALLLVALMLIVGKEGAICLGLAGTLAILPAFGGMLLAKLLRRKSTLIVVAGVLTLAAIEPSLHGKPDVYLVEDSILVHATPQRTWETIVSLSDVAPSHDWIFRSGIACPQRTKIVDGRVGGKRICTMSTGLLMERIDVWQPGRRLGWVAVSTPPPLPPLRETNPF